MLYLCIRDFSRALLCRSGNSKGVLLSHRFIMYIFFISQNKFFAIPGPLQLLLSLPEKSYSLSLFLKFHLFPEVFSDFPYKRDLSLPAQSLSQWERGGLTFPLLACVCHDCPRLCLPCALVYVKFLDQYLTYKYVLSKCKTITYWTYC